ncbi:MAG: hypothetical protein ACP5HG_15355 [Anaerolineae bacterium]
MDGGRWTTSGGRGDGRRWPRDRWRVAGGKRYKKNGKIKTAYYEEELPPRQREDTGYVRAPMSERNFVPKVYGGDAALS